MKHRSTDSVPEGTLLGGMLPPWGGVVPEGVELAEQIGGSVELRGNSARIVLRHERRKYHISRIRIGHDLFVPMDQRTAEHVLGAIRTEIGKGKPFAEVVAPYLRIPSQEYDLLHCMGRFLEHEEERLADGLISPRTPDELRRMLKAGGKFSFWEGWYTFAIDFAALEDWKSYLAQRRWIEDEKKRQRINAEKGPLAPGTISNTMGELRRCLRWLKRRNELDAVPEFPDIPVHEKAPRIVSLKEQAAIIAAIEWKQRGVFLAMAHTLRPGEARALDLYHWSEPDMLVQQAMKGTSPGSLILGLKENDWRVVAADEELVEWIQWRIGQASAEEQLGRKGVPMFPNWKARHPSGRWGHSSIYTTWQAACKAANVPFCPPYSATKHSTATDLIRTGTNPKVLQRFLGHADQRSTDHYVRLTEDEVKGLRRNR